MSLLTEPRAASFSSGVAAEIDDPLTWGLDLVDETVAGGIDLADPTDLRLLREYRSFAGEELEVETLPTPCHGLVVEDVLRAALSNALVAPLLAFAEVGDVVAYRAQLRSVLDDVNAATCATAELAVGGQLRPCRELRARGLAARYVALGGRGIVVTGPHDLVNRVNVALRPMLLAV